MPNRVIKVDLDKIKRLANEHEITIHNLEEKANLKNGTIRKWDKAMPKLSSLLAVADVFGIDYWKLTSISGDK